LDGNCKYNYGDLDDDNDKEDEYDSDDEYYKFYIHNVYSNNDDSNDSNDSDDEDDDNTNNNKVLVSLDSSDDSNNDDDNEDNDDGNDDKAVSDLECLCTQLSIVLIVVLGPHFQVSYSPSSHPDFCVITTLQDCIGLPVIFCRFRLFDAISDDI